MKKFCSKYIPGSGVIIDAATGRVVQDVASRSFRIARPILGLAMIVLAFQFALSVFTAIASAQTDITTTVTALSGYWTVIQTLAIAVVLFVLGRRLLRKV
jgi:energy-converting hydrogenase Eha subunit E